MAVGYDNVNVDTANMNGIAIGNTDVFSYNR
jgi:lactate dehydrogenase-like 2-hydroxyacid dehydrogenase